LERIGGHKPTRTTSHNSNIPNPHENLKPFIKAISQICKPNRAIHSTLGSPLDLPAILGRGDVQFTAYGAMRHSTHEQAKVSEQF
jgi:hypothetical protein